MKIKSIHIVSLFAICTTFNCYAYEDPCVNKFLQSHASNPTAFPLEGAYFEISQCVLESTDTTEVAKKAKAIKLITKDGAKDKEKSTQVRAEVSTFLQNSRIRQDKSMTAASDYPDIEQRQKKLTSLMSETSLQIARMDDTGTSVTSVIMPDTASDEWYSLGKTLSKFRVSFKDVIIGTGSNDGACDDVNSDKCKVALESMADWLRYQKAASIKIHPFYSNKHLYDFQDYTVLREERWYSFFDVTNYPLPWESLINQQFDRFTYVIGDYGLAEPPDEQLTILRPSVGVGFANGHGQSPTPELVLEIVGYTTWEWEEANAVNRWGLSVIGTLGEYKENNDTKTNPGIGLMLHTPTPGISLGLVAREHGKSGLVVTFDVINLWDERKRKVNSVLSEIDQILPDVN